MCAVTVRAPTWKGRYPEEQLPKSNGVIIPNFTGSLMDWTKVVGNQFQPACTSPSEWHIAAAVLGETAAYAQYVRR